MQWREFIKDYLTFTRKERIGVLVILFLIILVALLPEITSRPAKIRSLPIDTAWMAEINKMEIRETKSGYQRNEQDEDENMTAFQYDRKSVYSQSKSVELFYFDPNTVSFEGWQKLGIKEKTIRTIQNYISKGGQFRKAEDLKRIFGFRLEDYNRLAPYIQIKNVQSIFPNESKIENKSSNNFKPRYPVIDINLADTTEFIALPGIGSRLAARIVNYREKLGGFYSIDQISETYALPDSTFQKIKQFLKLETAHLRKININTVTVDELKTHPYLKWSLANPIISYRNEHGAFTSLEDLKKIAVVTDEVYNKILPYLVLQ